MTESSQEKTPLSSDKSGWVRFHRRSMDSSVWENPVIWYVWSWCLLKANHKPSMFPFNGKDMFVGEGQFITGCKKALIELHGISVQNWRTAIKYLKSTDRITVKSTNKFSLITIVNWKSYQFDNRQTNIPLTNEQQTTNKPLTTYKNDKNDKNDKNKEALTREKNEIARKFRIGADGTEQELIAGVGWV